MLVCLAPAGHSQPDHQVIAIAINSGLVTYPTGFTLVWESPGVSLWRPVPPPGYVSMGCLASINNSSSSSSSAVPPARKTCVVVAQQVVVEALLAECMLLCTNGNLWCIQNSCGSFEVAPPDTHQPLVSPAKPCTASQPGMQSPPLAATLNSWQTCRLLHCACCSHLHDSTRICPADAAV